MKIAKLNILKQTQKKHGKKQQKLAIFLLRSEKIIIKYVFISSDINLHIVAEFHFLLGVFVGTAYISDNYCYYCLSSSVDVYYFTEVLGQWAMGMFQAKWRGSGFRD